MGPISTSALATGEPSGSTALPMTKTIGIVVVVVVVNVVGVVTNVVVVVAVRSVPSPVDVHAATAITRTAMPRRELTVEMVRLVVCFMSPVGLMKPPL
jgi:hypothetical protein